MALVGYARVSSVGQSLDIQLEKLGHCDKIFQEKKRGASDTRPRLADCLEYVREGDKYLCRIIFIFFGSERDEGVASAYFPEEKIQIYFCPGTYEPTQCPGYCKHKNGIQQEIGGYVFQGIYVRVGHFCFSPISKTEEPSGGHFVTLISRRIRYCRCYTYCSCILRGGISTIRFLKNNGSSIIAIYVY